MTVITDGGITLWVSLPCIPGVRMQICCGVCKSAGIGMWVGASVSDESEDMELLHFCLSLCPQVMFGMPLTMWMHISPPVQEGKVILEKALVGEENGIEGEEHIIQN